MDLLQEGNFCWVSVVRGADPLPRTLQSTKNLWNQFGYSRWITNMDETTGLVYGVIVESSKNQPVRAWPSYRGFLLGSAWFSNGVIATGPLRSKLAETGVLHKGKYVQYISFEIKGKYIRP